MGLPQALSQESQCPRMHGARYPSPPLIPALIALSLSVDPPQTAAFPGPPAACARRDITLPRGLSSALQTSLFLPLNGCLVGESLRASTRPRPCSAQHRSAPLLPRIPHPLLWVVFFPGDWLALGFAPPGLMPLTSANRLRFLLPVPHY